MPTIQVRFRIDLTKSSQDSFHPDGPRFHRWLPNGADDAIDLLNQPNGTRLIVWFERFGITRHGFIEFAEGKREVDPEILARQGHVDAGPLFAQLWVNVEDEELRVLTERMEKFPRTEPGPAAEPQEVVQISKRIYRLTFDRLAAFIDTLKVTFGQFWLESLPSFDSREQGIVAYLEQQLGVHSWSADGTQWTRYPGGRFTLTIVTRRKRDYRQFLTQDDWGNLSELAARDFRPSLGAQLLSRAVQLFGLGHTSEAFVQAVAGLEVIVSEFIEERKREGKDLARVFPGFSGLSDRQKLSACALLMSVDAESLRRTQQAIDVRNEIVHEGKVLPDELGAEERAMLRTAVEVGSTLCPNSKVRFVELFASNTAPLVEHWESEEA